METIRLRSIPRSPSVPYARTDAYPPILVVCRFSEGKVSPTYPRVAPDRSFNFQPHRCAPLSALFPVRSHFRGGSPSFLRSYPFPYRCSIGMFGRIYSFSPRSFFSSLFARFVLIVAIIADIPTSFSIAAFSFRLYPPSPPYPAFSRPYVSRSVHRSLSPASHPPLSPSLLAASLPILAYGASSFVLSRLHSPVFRSRFLFFSAIAARLDFTSFFPYSYAARRCIDRSVALWKCDGYRTGGILPNHPRSIPNSAFLSPGSPLLPIVVEKGR